MARAPLKTTPNQASVEAFLDGLGESRLQDCRALLDLMVRVTGEPPRMWGDNIVGFGSYHYRYESGREGDSCLIGFSPRKQALTLYIMPGFARFDSLMQRLGKYKTGKSCLYFNRLGDVDVEVLESLVSESVRYLRAKYG